MKKKMKKTRKMAALLLAVSMILSAFAGCGSDSKDSGGQEGQTEQQGSNGGSESTANNTSGFPITEETIELEIFRTNYPGTFENLGDMWRWKDYAEKTNINVEWMEEPRTSYTEKLNIQLTTGNLPDAYYALTIGSSMVYENGQNGNFIVLNDLIDQYAPNIKKLFEEYPAAKEAVTMPDGNIYSLPWVTLDTLAGSTRTYVNEELVDELGVKFPETIDELTTFMEAMKEKYPDTYPMVMAASDISVLYQTFYGAWGLGNTGLQGLSMRVDLGEDGNLRFIPASDEYKAMLKQFAEWYADGLIHPESFTTMDITTWQGLGAQNKVGVFSWVAPSYVGSDEIFTKYKGVSQFKGCSDNPVMSFMDAEVRNNTAFIITKENEYPVETIKWIDYFYSEEGELYANYGEEGVTYAEGEDGIYEYIGEAAEAYEAGTLQNVLGSYGGYEPGLSGSPSMMEFKQKWIDPNDETDTDEYLYQVDDLDDYLEYMPENVWNSFASTEEEADEISVIYTDLSAYVSEMMTNFITGKADVEADWDEYLATLDELKADRYLEIRQTQYERIYE